MSKTINIDVEDLEYIFEKLSQAEKDYHKFLASNNPLDAMVAFRKQDGAIIEVFELLGIAKEYEEHKCAILANEERS